jgi:polyhydroxybutyrate depolymerase
MRWSPLRRAAGAIGTRRALAVLLGVGVLAAAAAVVNLAAEASGTSPAAQAPATTCGSGDSPGTFTLSVPAQGLDRTVIVHVPPSYRSGHPDPLVLNLHGSGSTAANQERVTGMDATADEHQFIVAYPQAAIRYGKGYAWNVPGVPLADGKAAPRTAANDVTYLTGLSAQLGQRYCVEANRVYVAGFSGGGRMTSQLGCAGADVFAAIAPVSGLRMPSDCQSSTPMAVIAFHGTADRSNPYDGGGQRYWTYSVPTAENRWASHDQCASEPTVTTLSASLTPRTFEHCADGSAVQLYTVLDGGHQWPVSANAIIWSFFAAHPRQS